MRPWTSWCAGCAAKATGPARRHARCPSSEGIRAVDLVVFALPSSRPARSHVHGVRRGAEQPPEAGGRLRHRCLDAAVRALVRPDAAPRALAPRLASVLAGLRGGLGRRAAVRPLGALSARDSAHGPEGRGGDLLGHHHHHLGAGRRGLHGRAGRRAALGAGDLLAAFLLLRRHDALPRPPLRRVGGAGQPGAQAGGDLRRRSGRRPPCLPAGAGQRIPPGGLRRRRQGQARRGGAGAAGTSGGSADDAGAGARHRPGADRHTVGIVRTAPPHHRDLGAVSGTRAPDSGRGHHRLWRRHGDGHPRRGPRRPAGARRSGTAAAPAGRFGGRALGAGDRRWRFHRRCAVSGRFSACARAGWSSSTKPSTRCSR